MTATFDAAANSQAAEHQRQEIVEHVAAGGSPFDYVDRPAWFSFSTLDLFRRCPRQYALQQLCGLESRRPRPAADFGSAAHAAFETFTRERRERPARGETPPSREDLERFFEEARVRSSLAAEVDADSWRERAKPMLDDFFAAEVEGCCRTIGEETRFRLRVELDRETRVAVSGVIDRLDKLPSGAVELIDYKTGRPWSANDAESNFQLSIYALGCRDALGLGPPERVTLNFVEHGVRFSAQRTDCAMDGVREELAIRAREIRNSDFTPTPGEPACSWCDFGPICDAAILGRMPAPPNG